MFTRNWTTHVRTMLSNTYPKRNYVDVAGTTVDVVGAGGHMSTAYNPPNVLSSALSALGTVVDAKSMNACVVFGDGNTAPAYDDYTLSGNAVAGIAATITREYTDDDDKVRIAAVYTVTNNNAEDVTISEAGVFVGASYHVNSNGTYFKMMIARVLLEVPITIPAGGVGQVTLTFNVNLPYQS